MRMMLILVSCMVDNANYVSCITGRKRPDSIGEKFCTTLSEAYR